MAAFVPDASHFQGSFIPALTVLLSRHSFPCLLQVGSAKAKPSIPADISPEAVNFLELTFELDHELRPSAADLLKHPWVANTPSAFGQ